MLPNSENSQLLSASKCFPSAKTVQNSENSSFVPWSPSLCLLNNKHFPSISIVNRFEGYYVPNSCSRPHGKRYRRRLDWYRQTITSSLRRYILYVYHFYHGQSESALKDQMVVHKTNWFLSRCFFLLCVCICLLPK